MQFRFEAPFREQWSLTICIEEDVLERLWRMCRQKFKACIGPSISPLHAAILEPNLDLKTNGFTPLLHYEYINLVCKLAN